MFTKPFSINILVAVCSLSTVSFAQLPVLPPFAVQRSLHFPVQNANCDDSSFILNVLKLLPSRQAFSMMTLPLAAPCNPPQIQELRIKLLQSIEKGEIDVSGIIPSLRNVGGSSKYDVLIAALLALSEGGNVSCEVNRDLTRLIMYLLKRRYLQIIDNASQSRYETCARMQISPKTIDVSSSNLSPKNINLGPTDFGPKKSAIFPMPIIPKMPIGPSGIVPYTLPPRIVIRPTLPVAFTPPPLAPYISEAGFPGIISPRPSFPKVLLPGAKLPKGILHPKLNVEEIVNLIPKPKQPKDQVMYEKLIAALKNPLVMKALTNINLTQQSSKEEILQQVLRIIKKVVITKEVEEVVSHYMTEKKVQEGFDIEALISVLPQPKSPQETEYLTLIKKLLLTKNIQVLLKSLTINTNTDLQSILFQVLNYLITTEKVPMEVLPAIKYIIPVVAGQRSDFKFETLISLLPAPKTKQEIEFFETIKTVLNSNLIYVLMSNVSQLSIIKDKQQLLDEVLRILITMPQEDKTLTAAATYYLRLLITKRIKFNYFELLDSLNLSGKNQIYREIIERFMYTKEFEKISRFQNFTSLRVRERLMVLLQIIKNAAAQEQIRNAAANLLKILDQLIFFADINRIIQHIPQPATPEEISKYTIVKNFLNSEYGYKSLAYIDRGLFPDDKALAQYIFKTLAGSNVAEDIRQAFAFYSEIIKKLESFVVKKQITKRFNIGDIVTDAMDIHAFNSEQKKAFNTFYKYMGIVDLNEVLPKLDSWDHIKTKGEFMKILFSHFLEQPAVPPDVKMSIQILLPIVKIDGTAALPP